MNLLKNKKLLITVVFFVVLYFLLSFIVAFTAFSIGDETYEFSPSDLNIPYEAIQ